MQLSWVVIFELRIHDKGGLLCDYVLLGMKAISELMNLIQIFILETLRWCHPKKAIF